MRVCVSIVRLVLAGFLFVQGTKFLVFTIEIDELLLNAVALEFVIQSDELLFVTMAPARAKRLVDNTEGFTLASAKSWRGLEGRSLVTMLCICGANLWAFYQYMAPQHGTLEDVSSAICGGDQVFVYALDGVGAVAWGFPETARTGFGHQNAPDPAPFFDTGLVEAAGEDWEAPDLEWKEYPSDRELNFQGRILNSVRREASNNARSQPGCGNGSRDASVGGAERGRHRVIGTG